MLCASQVTPDKLCIVQVRTLLPWMRLPTTGNLPIYVDMRLPNKHTLTHYDFLEPCHALSLSVICGCI